MPVFKIDIVFTKRKRHQEYRIVDGVDLDTYYTYLYRYLQRRPAEIAGFEIVQLSEHSRIAKLMRANNAKRMTPDAPTAQPRRSTGQRRRRL